MIFDTNILSILTILFENQEKIKILKFNLQYLAMSKENLRS